MRKIQPSNRLCLDFLGILTILALNQWQVVIGLGCVLLLLSMIQKRIRPVWQGLGLASPFLLAAVLLGWFSSGGWVFARLIFVKLLVIVFWNSWIFADFSEMDLIRGLRELRVPQVFSVTIFFIFRYRELLRDEMRVLRLAREIRGGRLGVSFSSRNYHMLGEVMGAGLVRALDRGDRVHQAMRLRGLKVETLVQGQNHFHFQKGWLLLMMMVVCCIFIVDRGGFFTW